MEVMCYHKNYYQANKEKLKAQRLEYYYNNKEKVKAITKAYREANKEKIYAINKKYKEFEKIQNDYCKKRTFKYKSFTL